MSEDHKMTAKDKLVYAITLSAILLKLKIPLFIPSRGSNISSSYVVVSKSSELVLTSSDAPAKRLRLKKNIKEVMSICINLFI